MPISTREDREADGMSNDTDTADLFRRAASCVDRILRACKRTVQGAAAALRRVAPKA
jgi:hypothetical protein